MNIECSVRAVMQLRYDGRRGRVILCLMDGDFPEIELIDIDDSRANGDLSTSEALTGRRPSALARGALVAVAFLLLGMILGQAFLSTDRSSKDQPDPTVAAPEEDAAPPTQPASSTAAPGVAPATVPDLDQIDAALRLLPDSAALKGAVALAEFATFGQYGTVWVIEPGRLAARADVPLTAGDSPRLFFTGDHIAFMSPPDVYLLRADLAEPAASVASARYLLAGATPGFVWAMNDTIDTATRIDMTTGRPGYEIELGDGLRWVSAAVLNGFVVNPEDEHTYGRDAYWTVKAPLVPISLPSQDQSGIWAVAGDTLLVVSPGPLLSAVNVRSSAAVGVPVDIGEGLVSAVCASPDQRYAVVVGSTGTSVVVDFEQEEVIAVLSTEAPIQTVSWTSNTQLVYIDAGLLVATDVVDQARYEIAQIDAEANWSMATSATMC